jgi:UDP:flavonoid glycosyltransferase YjiC (YdhE family)
VVRPVQSIVGGVGRDVARVLAEPSFRAAAGRWAARYAEVDGPGVAADRIVALHAHGSGAREVAAAYR